MDSQTYADDKVTFSECLKELREEIRKETLKKLGGQKFQFVELDKFEFDEK